MEEIRRIQVQMNNARQAEEQLGNAIDTSDRQIKGKNV